MKEIKNDKKKGFAGSLAEQFIHSKLTPVIIVGSLLLGLISVYLTPKEEEPQISVPMIDIFVQAPGFEADEVERKVTEPIERAVWGLDGVEYVYSSSSPHYSLITVRFLVGLEVEPSLVKVHHKIMEIYSSLPGNVLPPKISSHTIDDVPFLTLSFSSDQRDDYSLRTLIAPLARELSSTPDLSKIELLGGRKRAIRVIVNGESSSNLGVGMVEIAQALKSNDVGIPAGKNWNSTNLMDVEVEGRVSSAEDVRNIPLAQRGGRIVRLRDLADVIDGPEERNKISVLFDKALGGKERAAVSVVFGKRKGTNVVPLAADLIERAKLFSSSLPEDIKLSVVRDYGSTAGDKSMELIEHLMIATLSVAALIALWMGWRASAVVSIAIPVTLALTLAIYYFMGYTLNRVTLFALIFSIGILVDDAIVVVENIERHLKTYPKRSLLASTIAAVTEVGNPTILATFTVIAAILPMAFVRGLMGPYMKPIPVGASLAMILSLFVAFTVTPWAAARLLHKEGHGNEKNSESKSESTIENDIEREEVNKELERHSFLDQIYIKVIDRLLSTKIQAFQFSLLIGFLLLASFALVATKIVKVKMLPFDNKNEFQVLLDFPTETNRETSIRLAKNLSLTILENKNIDKIQIHSGEAAPYSFSGMVKHTFLRNREYMVDMQIVILDKSERSESSHEIIESLRPAIEEFSKKHQAISKILEIPPGPPVLATMVAEVYGPDRETRRKVTEEILEVFKKEPSVVDLDSSLRKGRDRLVYSFDHSKGGQVGARADIVSYTGKYLFSENSLFTLKEASHPEEIFVDLAFDPNRRSSSSPFLGQKIPSFESGFVNIDGVIEKPKRESNDTLYRKNLKPVEYIFSEFTGAEEAPVYGMLKLAPNIRYETQTADVPWNTTKPIVKWDGEWFITYEVFRDLGGAFAVVMVLIYILVLGWFRSYTVPLIIMIPIPISLIGILPGHAILGSYFTATSMIGFIAGAGIIVRNSIILVDFIEQEIKKDIPIKTAVVNAGLIRFRPMLLTAAAVVAGAFIMLFDPIFNGLAISLMFGEVAATLLSRFAVPVLYYWFLGESRWKELNSKG
ncbi:MAG: efflux RND transporter permease subunit [Leptospiraceae bacterium]|nr:efflux RND transporter permease subunit [Leptospiraceae bacterium]MCZ8347270.1 efflux RND transporter permease subunit [Leptospiraceae bacterium]